MSSWQVAQRRFESRLGRHSFGWTYCGSHNFSPAAWGQQLPPPKANPTEARAVSSGPRLHICNYELGIILIIPPSAMSKQISGRRHEINDIVLPFVVPPPQYKLGDRPATSLAMREAMAEARILQSNDLVLDLSQDTDEDIPDEDDEHVIELSDCSPEEKEEEKIYAETLWEQVDSSQRPGWPVKLKSRCFGWQVPVIASDFKCRQPHEIWRFFLTEDIWFDCDLLELYFTMCSMHSLSIFLVSISIHLYLNFTAYIVEVYFKNFYWALIWNSESVC